MGSIPTPTPQSQLHIRELGGIISTEGNARLQELGQKFLSFHCQSWLMQMITAETKRVAASSLVVLHRVTLSVFLTRSVRLGVQGYLLQASQMPELEHHRQQTDSWFWGTLRTLLPETQKIWAGFAQSIQGIPQLLPTIYPHSFNWVESKSRSSAEPDTEVISSSIN